MTFRHLNKRIEKWGKKKFDHLVFVMSKTLFIKRKTSYWKNYRPLTTDGYPVIDEVWGITFKKLTRIEKIRYADLYEFYFVCFYYYLHFAHESYSKKPTKIEALKEHDKYINYLYDQEKKRQDNIDNKARQVITNTSIVITIIGLFITILSSFFKDKIDINNSDFYFLILVLVFLFISLFISVYVLNLKKYRRPIPEMVFIVENRTEEMFLRNKVTSFHYPIILNTGVNSKKSNNIIFANYSYILALVLVLWVATKNIYSLAKNDGSYKVTSEKPQNKQPIINNVTNIDTTIMKAVNNLKIDTIKVRIINDKNKTDR